MTKPRLIVCLCFGLFLLGCGGGNVGTVTGKVTLDGEPLKGATVTFQPEDGARPSIAITDDSGNYELLRTREVKGAAVGKHRVTITSGTEEEDESGENVIVKERVPARYNVNSELVKEVEPGSNEIDFELDSKGEIIGVGSTPRVVPDSCGGEEPEEEFGY